MSPSGSGEAVPSASRHQVLNAPDAAVATAILAFVHTLETNVGSANSRDRQRELARYAAAALDAAEGGPAQAALERALEDCGWVGCCFADQPDSFRLGARLKCLLYRGLKQQGEGTYRCATLRAVGGGCASNPPAWLELRPTASSMCLAFIFLERWLAGRNPVPWPDPACALPLLLVLPAPCSAAAAC